MPSIIRNAIKAWLSWCTKQRLYRVDPVMREIDREIKTARQGHKKHSDLDRLKQSRMLAMLRGG